MTVQPNVTTLTNLKIKTNAKNKYNALFLSTLTTAQMNALIPSGGEVIYNVDDNTFRGYVAGTGWKTFAFTA